jgi:hypothetical protein
MGFERCTNKIPRGSIESGRRNFFRTRAQTRSTHETSVRLPPASCTYNGWQMVEARDRHMLGVV